MKKQALLEEEKNVHLSYLQDDVILSTDLRNFPHGDKIGSKDFEDGRHIDFYEAVPGIKVRAYDEKRSKSVWAGVSHWSVHTGSKLEIVNLSNKDQVFTDNDPRAIFGIPFDSTSLMCERFTPNEALSRKVMVPCLRGKRAMESSEVWPYWDFTNKQLVKTVPEGHFGLELNFDFGQFLGILAGNGWWNHGEESERSSYQSNWFFLADLDGYEANAVEKWLSDTIGMDRKSVVEMTKDKYDNRYGSSARHSFKSSNLPVLLDFLNESLGGKRGVNHAGAGSKHLPKWLSVAPESFCRGLLCGLIATDGCVTVNGSEHRSKPQLLISYTTISFDLARDLRMLCWRLGVKASICFARVTTGGNNAWVISLSTTDAREADILRGMCNKDKLSTFYGTEVSLDDRVVKKSVPAPSMIVDKISKWLHCPNIDPQTMGWIEKYYPEEWEERKRLASLYAIIRNSRSKNTLPKRAAERIIRQAMCDGQRMLAARELINAWVRGMESGEVGAFDRDDMKILLRLLEVTFPYTKQAERNRITKAVEVATLTGENANRVILENLRNIWIENVDFGKSLMNDPDFIRWRSLVEGDYEWACVVSVDKTNEVLTGYDITVPGYETFTSDTGVVLSNTMTYYVPVSQKAVEEANRLMLPSKNQLAARDFNILPELQEELVSGAFLASRKKNTPPKAVFNTKAEALDAYRRGLISVDDNIVIRDQNG